MSSEPESQADESPAGAPRRRRRWLRRIGWLGLALLLLLVIAVSGVFWVLGNLDEDPVKGWLRDALRDAGVEADWEVLEVSLLDGTLHVEDLVVPTPPEYRAHAPHLLRVGTLDARLDPWSALSETIEVARVGVRDVQATIVRDGSGRTSLDALLERLPPPEEEPEPSPPSHTLELEDLGRGLRLDTLEVTGLAYAQIDVRDGRVAQRVEGRGLGLRGSARVVPGDLRIDLSLSSPDGGTRITLGDGQPAGEAILDASAHLGIADSHRVTLRSDVDVRRQTLVPDLPASFEALRLEAEVGFHPDEGRTRIVLQTVRVLRDMAHLELVVELMEDEIGRVLPVLRSGRGHVRVERTRGGGVPAFLAALPDLQDLELILAVEEVGLEPAGLATGEARLTGTLGRGVVEQGPQRVEARDVRLEADLAMPTAKAVSVRGTIRADRVEADGPDGARVEVEGPSVGVRSDRVTLGGAWEAATLEGAVERLLLSGAGAEVIARDVGLEGRVERDGDLVDARLAVPVRHLRATQGDRGLEARDARVEVLGDDLSPEGAPTGLVTARVFLATAEARTPARDVRGREVRVEVAGLLTPGPPYRARGHARAKELRVVPRRGPAPPPLEGPRVAFTADGVHPDAEQPSRSTGRATLTAALGPLHMEASLDKEEADAARTTADLRLEAPGEHVRWLPPSARRPAGLSLRRLGGEARVEASASGLHEARPRVEATVDGVLRRVDVRGPPLDLRTARLDLHAGVAGSEEAFEAEASLELASPRLQRLEMGGPLKAEGEATWDGGGPRLVVDLDIEGPGAPTARLDATVSHDRRTRRLQYDVVAALGGLEKVGLLMPADTVPEQAPRVVADEITLSLEGALAGLVQRFDGIRPVPVRPLFEDLDGQQSLEIVARGLDLDVGDLEAASPQLRLAADARATDGRVDGQVELQAESLQVASGAREIDAKGLGLRLEAASRGPVRSGVITASLDGRLAGLEQSFAPGLPVEDLTLSARASLERLTGLRLDRFVLDNPAGGTRLAFTGAMDGLRIAAYVPEAWAGWDGADDVETIPGRQSLTLEGVLTQDVKRLTGTKAAGGRVKGDGRLSVPFQVESGDRSLFRVLAAVEAQDVDLFVPAANLDVKGLSGSVPVEQHLAVGAGLEGGWRLLPLALPNTWRRVRFHDVHPYLAGESFLTAEHIRWQGLKIGPVAANLRVLRNVFSLDQLQIALPHGSVSGQIVAEYVPGDSMISFRGDVTGLLPKKGEEALDANAALVFRPEQLDLRGRVQIVRMSREHLRDILDLLDPYHANPDINQIRGVLSLGYPKYARMRIEHGFLSAHVELGGLASIVRLGDIRAVPVGPLLERWVAPYVAMGQGAEP
ncbi:MAG: hypothetical protein ACQEXJ_10390 [Myxococcota bacterium]